MGFVANFIRFIAVQNFENRLRFDKVTESLKVFVMGVFCELLANELDADR